ncbi:MAG: ribbon-helix-helix protein, CopG family [bacterium]|nr:ribbon-helix-helix protein, CopG family [bacterium]MDW8164785.1 ribbon-helix-helix protein, CopG family [Candidatus Omnitrophota bacterium]
MKRLGPQTKKLFEVKTKEEKEHGKNKKYTFILPVELMKKVKHKAIEEEKTISKFLIEALEEYLKRT